MNKGNILIVSSDKTTGKQLKSAFKHANYDSAWVTDPARAKIHARKNMPDLFIIDLSCEDFDGTALAQELRRFEFSSMVPILFLVVSGEKKSRPFRPQIGITDYILKPFNPDEVV